MSEIGVVAKIVAKAGKENETLEELKRMIAPTRKEDGCLKYVLNRTAQNPAEFWFVEEWTSKAALDKHMQTPHFVELEKSIPDITELVDVIILDPVG